MPPADATQPTDQEYQLAEHRANAACASCHDLIDPVGFALQNYDAVGQWREFDGEEKIDSSGMLPNGTKISSVGDIEAGLIQRPEMFVATMAEKLLTYALGRGIEPSDGPQDRSPECRRRFLAFCASIERRRKRTFSV